MTSMASESYSFKLKSHPDSRMANQALGGSLEKSRAIEQENC